MFGAMTAPDVATDSQSGHEEGRRGDQLINGLLREWAGTDPRRKSMMAVLQLRRLNWSIEELATEFFVSPRTVHRIIRRVQAGMVEAYGKRIGAPVEQYFGRG